jgi:hypothetical protein
VQLYVYIYMYRRICAIIYIYIHTYIYIYIYLYSVSGYRVSQLSSVGRSRAPALRRQSARPSGGGVREIRTGISLRLTTSSRMGEDTGAHKAPVNQWEVPDEVRVRALFFPNSFAAQLQVSRWR